MRLCVTSLEPTMEWMGCCSVAAKRDTVDKLKNDDIDWDSYLNDSERRSLAKSVASVHLWQRARDMRERDPSTHAPGVEVKGPDMLIQKLASSGNRQPDDEIMPADVVQARRRSSKQRGLQRRGTMSAMENYLGAGADEEQEAAPCASDGDVQRIREGMQVVRGPDWDRGDEDGGAGGTGTVVGVNEARQLAKVQWHHSGSVCSAYRWGRKRDLEECGTPAERQDVNTLPLLPQRRNSQHCFADPSQCIIIFDWDDTLFPTTYVRDDLELNWRVKMKDQRLDIREKTKITNKLDRCAKRVLELMRLASRYGKMVLVTLARSPWVNDSCNNFYPAVGRLIRDMNVPIVYAQEGMQVEYNKRDMKSTEEIEEFWSKVKGKAIARELESFYSQYEGQSWKNIISIGDSDFERLGTQLATKDYMTQAGIKVDGQTVEVDNHVYKVRTKTFKMIDQPTVEELTLQVTMLHKWLPLMVQLDNSFDVNLNDVDDPTQLQLIEQTLKGT